MNLESIENKEPLIKNFFEWLFNDDRIIDKHINLKKEIDFTLAPYYIDAQIYYPNQIANFFNTKAMKRLGRVSQLDLLIDELPNVYHNRLEHSKGVYYRKLEEMLYNFQKPEWRKEIENKKLKLYLLAELIKMAGHDIGHLPLSHALEVQIFSKRNIHEIIGKRIMLEDLEIQALLTSISPALPKVLADLYEKNILNFKEHDESNYDVDRLDYIARDNLYAGNPIFIPYAHYETISVAINDLGQPETDKNSCILPSPSSHTTIDVYDYSSLPNIEHFLKIRASGYLNMYFSQNTHIKENSIGALLKSFLLTDSQSGKDLRMFVTTLRTDDLDSIDLSLFLKWDDLKFYNEILDIAENHENLDVQLLATLTFPNMNAFLTLLYSHLNLHNKKQIYSNEDKVFLQKIKKLIQGQNLLSKNLRTPNFDMNNILIFSPDISLPHYYKTLIEKGFINSSICKVKAYNPKEPIYIKSANGKIYELSHHPDRKYDWNNKVSYINYIYTYIPFLRLSGFSESEIDEMRNFCKNDTTPNQTIHTVNMQPLQVGHNIEDKFLEI